LPFKSELLFVNLSSVTRHAAGFEFTDCCEPLGNVAMIGELLSA
jgi:hypothetical protein